jgi:hypothetical protein
VVHEALPDDRDRFKAYISNRPLGIGLIAAPVSTVPCSWNHCDANIYSRAEWARLRLCVR